MGRLDDFTYLVRLMVQEEWRLHSTLFSSERFLGFPVILAVLSAGAAFALALFGLTAPMLAAGTFLIALLLGAQVGSAGFEGHDALENLLGETTLVLYSTRTLPIRARTMLSAFLVKEVIYYSVLFLLPLVVGISGGGALGGLSPSAPFVVGVWLASIVWFLGGVVGSFLVAEVAVSGNALVRRHSDADATPNRFATLTTSLGESDSATIAAKTVIDVGRSSGGFWKLIVSSATLLAAAYIMTDIIADWVALTPAYGVLFGTLLSSTSFSIYTWVTRFDAPGDYRLYPIDADALLSGKALAFVLLELPVVFVYYLGVALFVETSPIDLLLGGIVLVGTVVYVFGVTVKLTHFDPSEYLFDSPRFLGYLAAIGGAYLPLLVVSLFFTLTSTLIAAISIYSVVLFLIGVVALRETHPDEKLTPAAR